MTENDPSVFTPLLEAFSYSDPLRHRLVTVLQSLPQDVQRDFLDDPRFRITPLDGAASSDTTLLALPTADGRASRCVVLRAALAKRSESYALYVIAHELAHAYLRNGAWGEILDPEEAADALATDWGYPRPKSRF